MKCPRCVQIIHQGASACPHCGFTIEDADSAFGPEPPRIHRLEDAGGLMRSRERSRVEKLLRQLDARFPDIFLAIHSGRRQGAENIRQFGFWLLNRAEFVDLPEGRSNEGGILLTIDPDEKAAALTWGYRLDPFLTERDSFLVLSRAHAYWVEGRFGEGIERAIEQLALVLIRRSRQARRHPGRLARETADSSVELEEGGSRA